MSLSRKLARLAGADASLAPPSATPIASVDAARLDANPAPPAPPTLDAPASAPASAPDATPGNPARAAVLEDLRARLRSLLARDEKKRGPEAREALEARRRDALEALPFAREETGYGPVYRRVRRYPVTQRHGSVPLHAALDARGDSVATVSLDRAMLGFNARGALFLDTETTGLAGGTGTLAFLVGIARFDGRELCVEQLFVAAPHEERAMLEVLADRIEDSTSLVTYNGKAFDLPLLRSRYVLNRRPPPREPVHLDLLHGARRVYGARVDGCRLVTLEREVLGFVREGDVPGGEIPLRYADWLREARGEPLHAVFEHNLWDVIAMAALLGELAARADGLPGGGAGRFEPSDRAGLARTAHRAGSTALALALAEEALAHSAEERDPERAAEAAALAAKLHRRRGDALGSQRALRAALAVAPHDARTHLSLAKLYEHQLRDPERALAHALQAREAEERATHDKRVARLRERLARSTLRLPGID